MILKIFKQIYLFPKKNRSLNYSLSVANLRIFVLYFEVVYNNETLKPTPGILFVIFFKPHINFTELKLFFILIKNRLEFFIKVNDETTKF